MQSACLLLASPRYPRSFPRGIVEIAGFLGKNGCPTEVLPLAYPMGDINAGQGFTPAQEVLIEDILRDTLQGTGASVIGIGNPYTLDNSNCIKILELCKRIDGRLITVIGGPHATFRDCECLSSPFVDVVVRGEGEWSMLDLLAALKNGADLGQVAGISFRREGRLIRTPDRALGDMADIPPLNFDLLPADFIRDSQIYGISSRGCAYRCSYCVESAFWRKKRNYPVKRLVDEMELLDKRFGYKIMGFFESMLDSDSSYLSLLCDEIGKRRMTLSENFNFHIRPDSVTVDRIETIRRAGMNRASMGVESVAPKVLKMMNRANLNRECIIEACRILREKGMHVHTYWIVGHPGDTPEAAEDSFQFLIYLIENDLCQSAEAMIFQPYPGTCFYEDPQRYGVEILESNWDRWDRFDSRPISQLADFRAEDIHAAWRKMDYYLHTWQRFSALGSIDLKRGTSADSTGTARAGIEQYQEGIGRTGH